MPTGGGFAGGEPNLNDNAVFIYEAPVKYSQSTITSAQLLALNATASTILAAPGTGLINIPIGWLVHKPAGVAYAGIASGEELAFKETDSSGAILGTCETTGFLDQTGAETRWVNAYRAASGNSDREPITNAVIVAHLLVGEIITGDSDLLIQTYYITVPSTLS